MDIKSTSIFFALLIGCTEVTPVRKKIQEKWDLPWEQRTALVVLSAAFLLGGGIGCLFAAVASGAGAEELSGYLAGYLALAQEEELPRGLWTLLWGQLKYPLAALVLSLTALGLAGLPLLFGVRGFFFSFPGTCFFRVFGWRGLFPSFVLFVLPALLWAPALFLIGVPGFLSAQQLLRRTLGEGRGSPSLSGAFWCRAGLCLGLTLAAGLLEYWVVPVLLRAAAHVVL